MIFKSYNCMYIHVYLYYFRFLIVIKEIICFYKISSLYATFNTSLKK